MATPVGVIKKFVETLTNTTKTGTAAVDEAMKAVGATSYNAFISKFNSDKSGLSTQDFLEQICGVRLNNTDTGAITGSDAGGKTIKTAESIVPESTAAKILTDEEYNSFTKNGLKVNIQYNNDVDYSKQKLVAEALYNWWIPESLNLIDESLGVNFTDGRANINEIDIKFAYADNNHILNTDITYDMGRASKVTLTINSGLLDGITAGDKNGHMNYYGAIGFNLYPDRNLDYNIYHSYYYAYNLDQLVLHALTIAALTIAALTANVSYVDKLPKDIALGLFELVGGYDSVSRTTTFDRFYAPYSVFNLPYYGYTLMRYLAKNYSGLPTGLSYNSDKTILTASTAFTGNEIDLAEFEGSVKTVNATALTNGVNIIGNTLANSIIGGKGADVLDGGAGNDTLTGGAGNDEFIYSAGKDVITDYTAEDKIYFGAEVSKTALSGSDVVFTFGNGTLTVKNGKNKTLSIVDSAGNSYTTLLGGSITSTTSSGTTLTVSNSTKSPVTVGADVKTINASSRTSAVKITGNALNNTINGGSAADSLYGGAGNDSILGNNGNDKIWGEAGNDFLSGGAGNDSLAGGVGNDTFTGGAGNDYFFYDSGKDIITDYTAGQDTIKISRGTISKSTLSGSDVIFTVGSGTLTVKNGKGKSLSMIDSAGKSFSTILGGSTTSTTSSGITLTVSNSTKSPVTVGSNVKTIHASSRTSAVKITGNALNNTINGGSAADSLYGGAGNDSILGNNGNDKIWGEAGNDFLSGGAGNDSLAGGVGNDTFTGGAGNDYFFYDSGKDIITDYTAGQDTIKISRGTISKSTLSGSDVVFTVGSGTLTVKNGKGKSLSLINSAGKSFSTILGGSTTSTTSSGTTLTVSNSTKSPVTVGADVKTINASSRSTAVKITGNALANSIIGGKGNDTLDGGTGNDSLWGNAGNDVFLYFGGEGNDVIYGFENNDMLLITGAFTGTYNSSKKEIAFKVGSTANAVTLKDFSATSFNVNGYNYSISGTKLVRK